MDCNEERKPSHLNNSRPPQNGVAAPRQRAAIQALPLAAIFNPKTEVDRSAGLGSKPRSVESSFSEDSIRFWKLIFKTKKATRLCRVAFLLNVSESAIPPTQEVERQRQTHAQESNGRRLGHCNGNTIKIKC